MNSLLLVIIVGVALLLLMAGASGEKSKFPYQRKRYLLSKAERSFFGVLLMAVGDKDLVFSKVRVADVITPKKGLNRSNWQKAFNAISSKHVDFIICSGSDCSVKLAIELDDSSHGSSKSQKRDALLQGACESAGLPLLRIKASKGYVISELREQIDTTINPPQLDTNSLTLAEIPASENVASNPSQESSEDAPAVPEIEGASTAPACPKCGESMVLRTAKSGSRTGQEFWGCSNFPKCRGVGSVGA